jgi:hypothetical protein
MPEFIYHFSSLTIFIILNLLLISISFLSITLLCNRIPLHFRYQENTAIISCSAFLSVTYAILIGFTILYQLNNVDKVIAAEKAEGKALYSIFRNSRVLPEQANSKIFTLTQAYAQNAINYEWPTMSAGEKINDRGKIIIEDLIHEVYQLLRSNDAKSELMNTVLYNISISINTLHDMRDQRVAKVHSILNAHIWLVLFFATTLALGINYLLGMEYRLHLVCITLICIMISAILYLIIGLDRPYHGDFAVQPDTIRSTLEYINFVSALPAH